MALLDNHSGSYVSAPHYCKCRFRVAHPPAFNAASTKWQAGRFFNSGTLIHQLDISRPLATFRHAAVLGTAASLGFPPPNLIARTTEVSPITPRFLVFTDGTDTPYLRTCLSSPNCQRTIFRLFGALSACFQGFHIPRPVLSGCHPNRRLAIGPGGL